MTRDEIEKLAQEAGWSGLYIHWAEPDGKPDWSPFKMSLTVPVTMEQIERFAALVAAHERETMEIFCNACAGFEFDPNMKHAFKVVAARLKQGRQG